MDDADQRPPDEEASLLTIDRTPTDMQFDAILQEMLRVKTTLFGIPSGEVFPVITKEQQTDGR